MRSRSLRAFLSIVFFILALLGIVVYGLSVFHQPLPNTSADTPIAAIPPTEEITQARQSNEDALSAQAAATASSTAQAPYSRTYRDEARGFSFGYPDSFKVGSYTDPSSGALTITAQDAASHVGFQVLVMPWQGASAITASEVQHDLPQIQAHNFKTVSLDGAPGISFAASDANFGDSLQLWLVHSGQLYQISTYATQGALLTKVLDTWKWGQ